MDRSEHIEELVGRMRALLESAFDRGVKVGETKGEVLRMSILEAVGISPDALSGPHGGPPKRHLKRRGASGSGRNPKGLTGEVVARVMKTCGPDGLTMGEIAGQAAALNHAVNAKSVYNEMKRRTDVYENKGRRWYNRGPKNAPPPADHGYRVNGSASGFNGTGLPFGEHSARAPAAAGEVGGT